MGKGSVMATMSCAMTLKLRHLWNLVRIALNLSRRWTPMARSASLLGGRLGANNPSRNSTRWKEHLYHRLNLFLTRSPKIHEGHMASSEVHV